MAATSSASDDLFVLLHEKLHGLATRAMAGERKDHTLQPTALLNEAWLRLAGMNEIGPNSDRAQVLNAAARAMREVLIDHARRRRAEKRGGKRHRMPLDTVVDHCAEHRLDTQDLDDSLEALSRFHERQATVITLRFLGKFTVKEVAALLDVSEGTVENDCRLARAWLRKQLKGGP